MSRAWSTRANGSPFDKATIDAVWAKATREDGYESFRKDRCGASVHRTDYGKVEKFGWEIDHVKPVASGGTDDLSNLQPLHWENNRHKGDSYPDWECRRTS